MLLRVVFSASLACGLAAASDQELGALDRSAKTLQACTQIALQNAVNTARQKKIAAQNELNGGINYPYVLWGDSRKTSSKTAFRAQSGIPACSIPLTQGRPSAGTRFELNKIHPLNNQFDAAIAHPQLPVCR